MVAVSERIRVLIVDDHPVVRRGLASFLGNEPDLEVVGAAVDGEEALKLADERSPEVVLMDLSMPGIGGIEATKQLIAAHPGIRVLMLTSFGGHERMVEALKAGAVGYVVKDTAPSEMLRALRSVARPQSLQEDGPSDPEVGQGE
jgi:DNA-binding NarL/FixJ family response regulator